MRHFLLLGCLVAIGCGRTPAPPPAAAPVDPPDLEAQVHTFCGACHSYPPAETFPRKHWKTEVERGFRFFEASGLPLKAPPLGGVVRYYEGRAPEELPEATWTAAGRPLGVRFQPVGFPGPKVSHRPAVSNVNLVHLSDPTKPDILACDMRNGLVMAITPSSANPAWRILGHVANPSHAEVIDLDGDGIKDVVVANLGSFTPTDRRCGSVVWLRGKADGTFTPITLLEGVGRVADVQAGHFRSKDKLDLIVGVYGWQQSGELLFLENQTTDWAKPKFVPRVLDERHGTIHVPVVDLNGDGRPDFVALISQEHETIVAFLNDGDGKFTKKVLYNAPHPGYGSSGIQLVDMNGDGRMDILYTNGDVLDEPYLFKPYHGVQWLENKGNLEFVHHPLTAMYGVHRAVAGDVDGDGDVDVVAVSFLPVEGFPSRKAKKADALVVLEQTRPGGFARHSLKAIDCDHVSCVLGDVWGTGRPDVVLGNFSAQDTDQPVTVWRNVGK